MSSQPLLRIRGLLLEAGDRSLLRNLNLEIHPGEFWCVLGRNGIGKSTLLHALAGLRPPDGGMLEIGCGNALRPHREYAPAMLARLRGLLPQHQFDAFSSSVMETVASGRFPYGVGFMQLDEEDAQARVQKALEQVGMTGHRHADITRLSGGERQRVALATLLVQDPPLCLLDEPTSHQDMPAQQSIMALLRELVLSQAKAVVASCHDINLAAGFATHVLILSDDGYRAGPCGEVLQLEYLEHAFACRLQEVQAAGRKLFLPVFAV
ncbi:ABC transporter ATP-binding protein [Herbaspirillum chlorophenolicum]|uniref:ABC transporter ATP-binding protein n=1 Tax=Herbaspirillum chlorophenolicum TaxID=211589 RepID=A0ABW8F1C8_9BURK